MKLIDIDAVVAEIGKLKGKNFNTSSYVYCNGWQHALRMLELYLSTLEVKEVDLEKEIEAHIDECLDVKFPTTNIELIKKDVEYTARKFFELGLKAKKGE